MSKRRDRRARRGQEDRDFAAADRIRDELKAEGIMLGGRAGRHYLAPGMNAPLYTTEILRLAASLARAARARSRGRTRRAALADLRQPDRASPSSSTRSGGSSGLSMQVHACAFGQASAALVERACDGPRRTTKSRRRWLTLSRWLAGEHDEAGRLAGPRRACAGARRAAARHGAILLPFRALLAAIEAAR